MMATATLERRTLARFCELIERADFDLKLAHDAGVAARVSFRQLQRIRPARRECSDLLREIEAANDPATAISGENILPTKAI